MFLNVSNKRRQAEKSTKNTVNTLDGLVSASRQRLGPRTESRDFGAIEGPLPVRGAPTRRWRHVLSPENEFSDSLREIVLRNLIQTCCKCIRLTPTSRQSCEIHKKFWNLSPSASGFGSAGDFGVIEGSLPVGGAPGPSPHQTLE